MSRTEKRACRREAFLRSAEAKVTMTGGKKKRASRTRIKLRRTLIATSIAMVMMVALVAKPNVARANFSPDVPEIDPGSIASAMTILIGGVLSLNGRTRRV